MNTVVAWAIIKTLCYAGVFSFPLLFEEIVFYLISPKRYSRKIIKKTLADLIKHRLVKRQGKYYLLQSADISVNREKRKRISTNKLRRARQAAQYLSRIPTIKLIGLSGGVARRNATYNDDIDLFVITQNSSLWLTRLLIILFLEMKNIRRKPGATSVANKICVNMLIDEHHLVMPFAERDVFSANEVAALKLIIDRNASYQKFLVANQWLGEFLANSTRRIRKPFARIYPEKTSFFLIIPLEWLAKSLQLLYMRRRRTKEVIQDGYVRFHPTDARKWILSRYRRRLKIEEKKLDTLKTSGVFPKLPFADAQEVRVLPG